MHSGSVPEIVELIGTLVDKHLAYPSNGDVYYRVAATSKISARARANVSRRARTT